MLHWLTNRIINWNGSLKITASRYLHPEHYRNITKLLHERRLDREQYGCGDFVTESTGLKENIEVYGRPKYNIAFGENAKKHLNSVLYDVRSG